MFATAARATSGGGSPACERCRGATLARKIRIAILIPYFGNLPAWMNFFVESCGRNRDIDWLIFNDGPPPENTASNVRHIRTGFDDYKLLLSDALNIRFTPASPYKLCDIKPALPYVHRDLVGDYDFVGFGDLDVIYGDIRSVYDDETLARYDLLSSHPDRVSGHLCLMRNSPEMVRAFEQAHGWKEAFTRPGYVEFDERAFFKIFRSRRRWIGPGMQSRLCLFREGYSTPGAAHDMRWFWKDGRLTNEFYPQHPFMYLHFMSWHSNRWYAHPQGVAADALPPWKSLEDIVQMDWRQARRQGFMISQNGIEPIPEGHLA
jgi:hypothetical protein